MKYEIIEMYSDEHEIYYSNTVLEVEGVTLRTAYKDFCQVMRTEGLYWRSLDVEAESAQIKFCRVWKERDKHFNGWVSLDWLTKFHNKQWEKGWKRPQFR